MKYKLVTGALAAVVAMLGLRASADELVIIVNKANTQAIDIGLVTKIYTGDMLTWSDGSSIAALDQSDDAVHEQFAKQIGKTAGNLRTIWARLMFGGKATPPRPVTGDAEVKSAVSASKTAIGYIGAASVDDTVKVVK
jgi:ABC-type phosphate transport system substrate-binding protein